MFSYRKHISRWQSLKLLLIAAACVTIFSLPHTIGARNSSLTLYATDDVTLEAYFHDKNYGYAELCYVGGRTGREHSTLLKWKVESLPKNSRINKATIQLRIDNPSPDIFAVYGIRKNWQESEATWMNAHDGQRWKTSGALSTAYQDGDRFAGKPVGTLRARNTGTVKIELDRNLVEDWLSGKIPNYGLIIAEDDESYATDDLIFFCSETKSKSYQPQLIVEFEY